MGILKEILYKVSLKSVKGDTDRSISGIFINSREVQPNGLFVAIRGTQTDGHKYIDSAVEQGATAVVSEFMPNTMDPSCYLHNCWQQCTRTWSVAANFYQNPFEKTEISSNHRYQW